MSCDAKFPRIFHSVAFAPHILNKVRRRVSPVAPGAGTFVVVVDFRLLKFTPSSPVQFRVPVRLGSFVVVVAVVGG